MLEKKKWTEIEFLNYPKLGEGVIQYLSVLLEKSGLEQKQQEVFLRVCEKMVENRIAKAYDDEGTLYAQVWASKREVEFTLRDLGHPYASQEIRTEEDAVEELALYMAYEKMIEDVRLGVEQLGKDGQMIKAKISIAFDGELIHPEQRDWTPKDTNFNVREVIDDLSDINEAIACIHQEYGFTYAYEGLYKVEEFKKIVKKGAFSSYLAVSDHGEIAGHLGLSESSFLVNMPEISSVVIKRQFRGLHFGDKMFEASVEQARIKKKPAVWVQPTAFHTGTQRICNKLGFTPCGFLFEYVNKDVASEYNVQKRRLDLAMAVKLLTDYTFSFYCPSEIRQFAEHLFAKLDSPVTWKDGTEYSGVSVIHTEVNPRTVSMKLVIEQAGEDFEKIIFQRMNQIQQEKIEMVEVLLSLEESSSPAAYEHLRDKNFVFTGMLPGSDKGVYCVMQYLCGSSPKFENLVATDGYREVLQELQEIYESKGGVL